MKILTLDDIRSCNPCFDPTRYEKTWSGTVLDILNHPKVSDCDKLWIVSQPNLLDQTLVSSVYPDLDKIKTILKGNV